MSSGKDYEHRVPSTEVERLAVAASKLAVNDALNELFTQMGVNRANFDSMEAFKKDIQFIRSLRKRNEIWSDLEFLHGVRTGSAKAGARFALALVTIFAGAFAYGMVSWMRGVFGK